MEKYYQIILPQHKETPITYLSIGNFHFRYAYERSLEAKENNVKGEDSLFIQTNGSRFVFVLCDGVGQSFFGGLAARVLGEKLGTWFFNLDLNAEAYELKTALLNKLILLANETTSSVQSYPIPDNFPEIVKIALGDIRDSHGSESTFVAGVIDIDKKRDCIAWMGDSRLRTFTERQEVIIGGFEENLFRANERWSTKKGPVGELHLVTNRSLSIDHLVVYSDGFLPLANYLRSNNQTLDKLISDSVSPASDDLSFLELWYGNTIPDVAQDRQSLDIIGLTRYFVNGVNTVYWLPTPDATGYDVKIGSDLIKTPNTEIVFRPEAVKKISSMDNKKSLAIRAWKNDETGEWSDSIELNDDDNEETGNVSQPTASIPPPYYPPLASAPPPKATKLIFILMGILCLVSFAITWIVSNQISHSYIAQATPLVTPSSPPAPFWGYLATIAKGSFVALILSLIPTIATWVVGVKNRIKLALTEVLLFSIATIGISYALSQLTGNNRWVLFTIFIISFLDIGAHIIDSIREATFRRIDKTWQYKSLRKDASSFDKLYNYERILYVALPLGIMLGTFIGLFRKATELEIALLSIQAVMLSAFLILVLITFKSFRQMIVPMYRQTNSLNQPPIFSSKQRDDAKSREEKMLSLVIMSTDLRKLYLYDSTHNILLLFLFIYAILMTYGIAIELKFLILAILITTLLFSQLPYVLGQYFLHQKALEPFEGLARAEVDEQIKKYAPLYPTFHFLAALITSGTAGGLAFFLLDNFIKGLFK